MKKLILIDSNALIHRAFHALPPLRNQTGIVTNAVYGFSSTLLKMLKDLEPDYIAAAYDLAGPTFRHDAFKDYKAHRAKAPDELYSQIPYTKKVLEAFGIPSFEMKGYEADDIIATLTKKLGREKDLKIIIVTGDLDALQLVKNKKIVVYTMKKGLSDTIIYDESTVMERYGLKPEQLTDYKGLKGDPSDNIPGVPGVGDKTASDLLKEYGSIENLYQKAKSSKTKIKESLKKKLLENEEQAVFSKHLAMMVKDLDIDIDLKKADWKKNFNQSALEKIFRELNFSSLISRIPEAKITKQELDLNKKTIIPGDSKNSVKKIQISAWLLNSELKEPTLDEIYFSEFNQSVPGEYKSGDISKLEEGLRTKLKDAGLIKIFEEIEIPLIPVLSEMEKNGFKIDKKEIEKLGRFTEKEIEKLKEKIHELAGVEFNINSTRQLSEVLFGRLKISGRIRKTPKGKISTRATELEKLREAHPIIPLILEYRELKKLKTTYIDPFPKLVDPKDGRLHTTFIQTGTVTGRLASQNPNLQNVPIKTELGQEFRKVFIAEKGCKLVSLDYSQLELRIAAHIAGDKIMIDAFKRGEDIHLRTAARVFGLRPDEVTPRMRREAKALNFGIIYGMGPQGFARSAGIKQAEAKNFIEKYFEEFPKVAEYMDQMRIEAHDKGIVKNLFGRRRQLSEIHSSIPEMVRQAERMAINFPIQGTAADLVKLAMIKIHDYLAENYKRDEVKMLLQIHDEIVLEVKEELAERAAGELKGIMESVYRLEAPLIAEAKVGDNWRDLKLVN
ncbi:MAG: DNA polymerase I [Parcubacteria group bacterium]|nr:DNA polymerase I [Parcubacteria group bacterium]